MARPEVKPGLSYWGAICFVFYTIFQCGWIGFWWQSKKWDSKALNKSCKGKTYIITGSNSGLGFEAAKAIAEREGNVIMVCRSQERGEKARQEIIRSTGNSDIELEVLDVARPGQIKDFCDRFVKSGRRLDYLVNHAGVAASERKETPDGYEETFAAHTLGPFLMTEWLLPALRKTPNSCVISTGSGVAYMFKIDVDDLESTKAGQFNGIKCYANQKRATLYLCELWTKREATTNAQYHPTFNWWHPGFSQTPGVDSTMPKLALTIMNPRSQAEGADTLIWLLCTDAASKVSNKVFFDRKIEETEYFGLNLHPTQEEKQRIYDSLSSIKQKWTQ